MVGERQIEISRGGTTGCYVWIDGSPEPRDASQVSDGRSSNSAGVVVPLLCTTNLRATGASGAVYWAEMMMNWAAWGRARRTVWSSQHPPYCPHSKTGARSTP